MEETGKTAKLLGKDIPCVKAERSEIYYSYVMETHHCTGTPKFEYVQAEVDKKNLIVRRCKTCGKLFRVEAAPFEPRGLDGRKKKKKKKKKGTASAMTPAPAAVAVKADPNPKPVKPQAKSRRRVSDRVTLEKGDLILMDEGYSHVCSGTPDMERVMANLFGGVAMRPLMRCRTCGKMFLRPGDIDEFKVINRDKSNYYRLSYDSVEQKRAAISRLDLPKADLKPQDFFIRTALYQCIGRDHRLQDMRAYVKLLAKNGEIIESSVPAIYCNICKQYYILETDYLDLLKSGIPVCKVVTIETFRKLRSGELTLNAESLLHSLGYNVNAQQNLSQLRRHKLLSIIISEKIMTRAEIMSHLDYLIRRSRDNSRLDAARQKWTNDRNFVRDFDTSDEARRIRSITYKRLYEYEE